MKKSYFITAALAMTIVLQMGLLPGISQAQQDQMPQFLFVQNGKSVIFEKGMITIKAISPTTLFFSDRPMRIAGHYTTEEFVQMWGEGKDSFQSDPPNATLSIFQEDRDKLTDVVVKLSNPRLEGDDLTYHVAIIEGQMPAKGGICSLFIDIIGMPFTPFSFAGAARRWTRRAVVVGAAATTAAVATSAAYGAAAAAAAPPPPTVIVEKPAPAPAPAAPSLQEAEQKLKDLKALYNQGLISQSEYDAKKEQILKSF